MNLSRLLTMMSNLGRFPRSFCQQSSISWWRASGQSCQNQHNTISQANSLSGLTVPYQQRQLIEHEFYIKGTKYCLHSLSSYRMFDHDINFAKGKIKDNSNKVLAYICHYLLHDNHQKKNEIEPLPLVVGVCTLGLRPGWRLDWTSSNMASLRRRPPPTWQLRNSTRHWPT